MGGLFGAIHRHQELGIERGRLANEQERTGIERIRADEEKRQHDLQEWQNVRTHALNMINERMMKESPSSALYGQLHQMAGKFLGAVPGDKNNAKLYQDFIDLHQVHPDHSEAIQQSKGGSLFGPPLPPGPGQTPGGTYQQKAPPAPGLAGTDTGITSGVPAPAPDLQSPSSGSGPGQQEQVQSKFIPSPANESQVMRPPITSGVPGLADIPAAPERQAPAPASGLTPPPAPVPAPMSAAQPAANPIQGHAQIRMPSEAPPNIPMPGLTPERSPLLGGPGPGPAAAAQGMTPMPAPSEGPFPGSDLYEQDMRTHGRSSPALEAQAREYYSHVAETKFKQAQMQAGIQRLKASGSWDRVPPYMQAQMEFEASGGKAVPMSSGLMTPIRTGSRVAGSAAPDGQLDTSGRPVDPNGDYQVMQDKMSGQQLWQPIAAQTTMTPTASGTPQVTNKRTGATIGAVEGGITPSMLGTSTSTSTSVTPEGGHNTARTVQKIAPGPASTGAGSKPVAGPGSGPSANITPSNSKFAPGTAVNNQPVQSKDTLGQKVRPFDGSNRLDRVAVLIGKDSQNWRMATNAADKMQIQKRMAELGIDPNNVTTSMRERAANANLIIDHLADVKSIINQAEKDGDLGVLMTRWNDFLSGKVGSDPTKNHLFSKLMTNREFLATAISMAHGGLRGGSSPQMLAHWETALQAKDAATLLSKLSEAEKWMKGYASMVPKELSIEKAPGASGAGGTSTGSTGGSTGKPSLDEIFKKK